VCLSTANGAATLRLRPRPPVSLGFSPSSSWPDPLTSHFVPSHPCSHMLQAAIHMPLIPTPDIFWMLTPTPFPPSNRNIQKCSRCSRIPCWGYTRRLYLPAGRRLDPVTRGAQSPHTTPSAVHAPLPAVLDAAGQGRGAPRRIMANGFFPCRFTVD